MNNTRKLLLEWTLIGLAFSSASAGAQTGSQGTINATRGQVLAAIDNAGIDELRALVKNQEARLQNIEDIEAISRLTRAYGYYVDKNLWDQVVELFAEDSTAELDQRGIFVGKKGVRRMFLERMGRGQIGMVRGRLFNHFQLQEIVTVAPDGQTAQARFRTFAQVAGFGSVKQAWNEGIYENAYVKENGVWKFSKLKFWGTYYTPYDQGWVGDQMTSINGTGMSEGADLPSTDGGVFFPEVYYPPYHYPHPVTGKTVDVSALNAKAAAERAAAGAKPDPATTR
jgi:SnoaL-like domain